MNKTNNSSIEIIPAIIPNDFAEISQKAKLILGLAKIVQIDLVDGKYVKNKSWPFNSLQGLDWQNILTEASGMPHWNELDYEIDLMVEDVAKHFNDLVRIGPKRIVFHFPQDPAKIAELKDFIKNLDSYYKYEIDIGIAYENGTNPEDILSIAEDIKFVQCMGIDHVGVQGAEFDESVFKRIAFVKSNLPNHIISVDGGVDIDTIKPLLDAGVNRFVCGSAIFDDDDPRMAISELYTEIK